jgi:hypothetical protein
MKLGKLLFAGKSVVSGNDRVSYRQNKQVALPKFSSPKNPFAPSKAPEETTPPNGKNGSAQPSAVETKPQISGASKSLAAWTSRWKPAALWGGSVSAERKTLPAIQAELSLGAVKVVHNDLSDADVEVVPIKSRSSASAGRAGSPPRSSWEILGERLLKATTL